MVELAKILVHKTTGYCPIHSQISAGIVGGTVSVEFDDPIWDRLTKTVVFRGTEIKIAEFDGKTAVIPWEVLEKPGPYLFFGIWGSDPDTDLQLPLIWVRIGKIEDATDPDADPGTDPTLPIWAQLKQDVEELKKGGVGGGGGDWNAAEGEPGHILNRTHWTEDGAGNEILPETALVMTDDGMFIDTEFALSAGESYTVHWNGVVYTCVAQELTQEGVSFIFLGDLYIASDGNLGTAPTGEPFALRVVPDELVAAMGGIYAVVAPLDGSTEATIAIYGGEVVHKLDNKYLNLDWLPVLVQEEIIPEQCVTTVYYANASYCFGEIPDTSGVCDSLEVGQTVLVHIDGVIHKASVVRDLDGLYIAKYGVEVDPGTTGMIQPIDDNLRIYAGSSTRNAQLWSVEPGAYTIRVITEEGSKNKIPEEFLPDDIGADLTGYATEQWVQDGYQPKGDYLESTKLTEAVDDALKKAKESGEFDGEDGKDGCTPVKGVDYFDGNDYVLTEADKTEIAEQAAELVEVPGISVTGATVGQTVKISAVDENGVPTAWESVDFPSGGGEKKWRKVRSIAFAEDSFGVIITEDDNGEPFLLSEVQFYFYTLKTGTATSCSIKLKNNGTEIIHYGASSILMTNYNQMNTRVHLYHDNIGYRCEQYSSYSGDAGGLSKYPIRIIETSKQNIDEITMTSNNSGGKFVAGSTIEIWGVDA